MIGFVKRVRDARDLQAQAETLRAFGSHRAVDVLDVRPGELVLERLRPGVPLAAQATEDEAMQAVAGLLTDGGWPAPLESTRAEPLALFARALGAPDPRLARAAAILRELVAAADVVALLHGDLHYGNVLSSDRARGGFLLIDAKGAIGDPAFDVGYLVGRPMPAARDGLPLARAIERRLAFLPGALGLDRTRVAAFAYVTAALSLAWAIEDGDVSQEAFAAAVDLLASRCG